MEPTLHTHRFGFGDFSSIAGSSACQSKNRSALFIHGHAELKRRLSFITCICPMWKLSSAPHMHSWTWNQSFHWKWKIHDFVHSSPVGIDLIVVTEWWEFKLPSSDRTRLLSGYHLIRRKEDRESTLMTTLLRLLTSNTVLKKRKVPLSLSLSPWNSNIGKQLTWLSADPVPMISSSKWEQRRETKRSRVGRRKKTSRD